LLTTTERRDVLTIRESLWSVCNAHKIYRLILVKNKSYLKNKKVLVAGGSGFVGSNLLKKLLDTDAHLFATRHINGPQIIDRRIQYIDCDLMNVSECRKVVEGMDYVFMCAAETSGAAVIEGSPLTHLTPNIVMNLHMLESAYNAGVEKFLFISSSVVYPEKMTAVSENEVDYSFHPKYYISGWMKTFTEKISAFYSNEMQKKMPVVILRPSNLYGEMDDFNLKTSHVIPALIKKVIEAEGVVEVWGSGEEVRDFLYIGDFIEDLLSLFQLKELYGPLNIGYGEGVKIGEVIKAIMNIEGKSDIDVKFNINMPTTIPYRVLDVCKADDILGFRQKTSLVDGLTKAIQWYKNNLGVSSMNMTRPRVS